MPPRAREQEDKQYQDGEEDAVFDRRRLVAEIPVAAFVVVVAPVEVPVQRRGAL